MNATNMFEDLGYKLIKDGDLLHWSLDEKHNNRFDEINIYFDKLAKTIHITGEVEHNHCSSATEIYTEELEAIHQQAKELGWLND